MDQPARQQIRLILEDARDGLERAVNLEVNATYRKNASRGILQSGNTLIACIDAMEAQASQHLSECFDRVKSVAMDTEAFAMVQEDFEKRIVFLSRKLDTVFITSIGGGIKPGDIGARKAALARFAEATTRLRRQLELQRFTFVVPYRPSTVEPANKMPAPEKPKGGKPLAAHWDDMWAAMAVALYSGDLEPATQADIERAMADWLAARNLDAAASTIRTRAQKLWWELRNFQEAK